MIDAKKSDIIFLKVGFTGAGGTGKTTLANELSKTYPDLELLTSTTRKVAKEVRGTSEGQKQILANFISAFMLSTEGYITDRTLIDVCAYSKVLGVWDDDYIKPILDLYADTYSFPDFLFYTPIEFPCIQDGGRIEDNADMHQQIDSAIRYFLEYMQVDYTTLTGSVEDRMKQILSVIS